MQKEKFHIAIYGPRTSTRAATLRSALRDAGYQTAHFYSYGVGTADLFPGTRNYMPHLVIWMFRLRAGLELAGFLKRIEATLPRPIPLMVASLDPFLDHQQKRLEEMLVVGQIRGFCQAADAADKLMPLIGECAASLPDIPS